MLSSVSDAVDEESVFGVGRLSVISVDRVRGLRA
jgi:hypothetical protein